MIGDKASVYFDSCIFIAWLKDEKRPNSTDILAVEQIIDRVKKREIIVITSTITEVEVAACKVGVGGLEMLDDFLNKKNLQRIAVDIKISKMARKLKDYYSSAPHNRSNAENNRPPFKFKSKTKTFTTPDAIHLATAILNKVDYFHTFDKELIAFSENVGGHELRISNPPYQRELFETKLL